MGPHVTIVLKQTDVHVEQIATSEVIFFFWLFAVFLLLSGDTAKWAIVLQSGSTEVLMPSGFGGFSDDLEFEKV